MNFNASGGIRDMASSIVMRGFGFALAFALGATTAASAGSTDGDGSQSRDIVPDQRSASGSAETSSSSGGGLAEMIGGAAGCSSVGSSSSGAGVISSTGAVISVARCSTASCGVQKLFAGALTGLLVLGQTGIGSGGSLFTEFFFQPKFQAESPPR